MASSVINNEIHIFNLCFRQSNIMLKSLHKFLHEPAFDHVLYMLRYTRATVREYSLATNKTLTEIPKPN